MLKLALATILVSGLVSVGPVFAEPSNSGIGRGCTLDPFTKTMRCIDFDKCTTDKNGKKTCPVVVTPTRLAAEAKTKGKGKGSGQQDYLIVTLKEAMITG
jgi:hypothetical protein